MQYRTSLVSNNNIRNYLDKLADLVDRPNQITDWKIHSITPMLNGNNLILWEAEEGAEWVKGLL